MLRRSTFAAGQRRPAAGYLGSGWSTCLACHSQAVSSLFAPPHPPGADATLLKESNMPNLRSRLITVPLASITLALGGAALAASTASAHESPTPVANVGDAVGYVTHQTQLHLDAPMLGL